RGTCADDLAIVDLCDDVGFTGFVNLMFAVLLDLFAKQGFPIEVLFLFGECDARCTDGAGRCDNPKCGTAIDHGYAPFLVFERGAVRGTFRPCWCKFRASL